MNFMRPILNYSFLLLVVITSLTGYSQTTIQTTPILNTKPILIGGGLIAGGSAHSFQMGLNPELVKSYTSYFDGGLAMNIYYESYNAYEFNPIRSRNFHYGISTFARLWPLESIFIQVQPEYNWTWSSQKDVQQGTSGTINYGTASFLAGIGYGHHSEDGMTYMSIMFDLANDVRSPYRNGFSTPQPIFRAGIGFPLALLRKKHL
jgi:hypothetical protein